MFQTQPQFSVMRPSVRPSPLARGDEVAGQASGHFTAGRIDEVDLGAVRRIGVTQEVMIGEVGWSAPPDVGRDRPASRIKGDAISPGSV